MFLYILQYLTNICYRRVLRRVLLTFLPLELVRKFRDETTCGVIPIDQLQIEVKHHILRAERVNTRYGPSIVLTIRCPDFQRYRVYLPRRYCIVVTDDDITDINERQIMLHLVYKGTCKAPSQHLLDLVHVTSM